MTKRAKAIKIMQSNSHKPMADVVRMIAEQIDVTDKNARSYYRWIVANGKAPGVCNAKIKTKKSEKKFVVWLSTRLTFERI